MTVLITGGAGFLGKHLARALESRGIRTHVLDDLSTGDPDGLPAATRLTVGDVRDVQGLWPLLADVDVVYHLAARVSVPESILYPVEYNAVNTGGTVSLMTAARDAGVRRVVFASSGTVYGDQGQQPIAEDAPTLPVSPYAVSKLAAEGYVRSIGDLYRIETVVLRVFNAYGAGQSVPSSNPPVIPHFAKRILEGGSLVLYGSPPGAQTRDFVHVDDVVNAMVRAGTVAGLSGSTFNIGSGRETSLLEVVAALETATGRGARTMAFPEHTGGVSRMCADIRRARSGLDWAPSVDLARGLSRLVADLTAPAADDLGAYAQSPT